MEKRCLYQYQNPETRKIEAQVCEHALYKEGYCIFHSPLAEAKKDLFKEELLTWMQKCERDSNCSCYDFQGFVFPNINFQQISFLKKIDFSSSYFWGKVNLHSCVFMEDVDFRGSFFQEKVRFHRVQFLKKTHFQQCQFSKKTNFDRSQFLKKVDFGNCEFQGEAHFLRVQFFDQAYFTSSQFIENAYFHHSQFSEKANFDQTNFFQRSDFLKAIFFGEVNLRKAYFTFLKNFDAKEANFNQSILENATYWKVPSLENCTFQDAFLISVSLNNKKIVNCDFTGATLGHVSTRGWKVDQETLDKTEYIYTSYQMQILDQEKRVWQKYLPISESRIPGEGRFGKGENQHFTLQEYLREPCQWSCFFRLPSDVSTSITNYIRFFSDFMKYAEQMDVELRTRKEGEKLRVDFLIDCKEDQCFIQEKFCTHLENRTKNFQELAMQLKKKISSRTKREIFIIRYENQIQQLKNELTWISYALQQEREHHEKMNQQERQQEERLWFFHEWLTSPSSGCSEE